MAGLPRLNSLTHIRVIPTVRFAIEEVPGTTRVEHCHSKWSTFQSLLPSRPAALPEANEPPPHK